MDFIFHPSNSLSTSTIFLSNSLISPSIISILRYFAISLFFCISLVINIYDYAAIGCYESLSLLSLSFLFFLFLDDFEADLDLLSVLL